MRGVRGGGEKIVLIPLRKQSFALPKIRRIHVTMKPRNTLSSTFTAVQVKSSHTFR